MKEIKNIDKNSLAKINGLIYGLVGFFVALALAVFTGISLITNKDFQGSAFLVISYNFGLGLVIGVLTAWLTAFFGWVMGYITAAIYNWFAGKAGGIKVKLTDVVEEQKEEVNGQRF